MYVRVESIDAQMIPTSNAEKFTSGVQLNSNAFLYEGLGDQEINFVRAFVLPVPRSLRGAPVLMAPVLLHWEYN